VFGEVTNIIKKEIEEFWSGVDVAKDKIGLDGDQILMLYVYICAKAGLKNIFAHIQFCSEFSTPYIKTTRVGYSLTTIEVALKLLCDERDLIDMAGDSSPAEGNFEPISAEARRTKRNSIRNSFNQERTFSLKMASD
jgi:hypothetical protein